MVMATVFCENINRKIEVQASKANLLSVLLAEGVRVFKWPRGYWPLHCRGCGHCRACVVEVVAGSENLNLPTGKELAKLKFDAGKRRLACQCMIEGNIIIRIRP